MDTQKVSPAGLPKCKPNKNSNRHANVGRENLRRPLLYKKNYRQLGNTESRRNSLLHRTAHQWVVQYQMVNPGNTHTNNSV